MGSDCPWKLHRHEWFHAAILIAHRLHLIQQHQCRSSVNPCWLALVQSHQSFDRIITTKDLLTTRKSAWSLKSVDCSLLPSVLQNSMFKIIAKLTRYVIWYFHHDSKIRSIHHIFDHQLMYISKCAQTMRLFGERMQVGSGLSGSKVNQPRKSCFW